MRKATERRSAATLFAALLLTGCAKVRFPANYVLALPPPTPRAASVQTALGTVAVREFRCADYICQGRIVYRPSAEQVGFYDHHRWAADPRETITRHLEDTLRSSGLFQMVSAHERGIRPAYILTGRIDRLEEVDEGRHVRAVCALSAQLADARTGIVVWSGTASDSVPVSERNVAGVVRGLSEAVWASTTGLTRAMTNHVQASLADGRETDDKIGHHGGSLPAAGPAPGPLPAAEIVKRH